MATRLRNYIPQEPVNYILIAISSQEKDYKLAYSINKVLDLQLSNSQTDDDLQEEIVLSSVQAFHYNDMENEFRYRFVQNRKDNSYLIPELKNVDYFFILQNDSERKLPEISTYTKKLRTIPGILAALEVRTNSIKNIRKLLN